MENKEIINSKSGTDGMYLRTASGKKFTKEMYDEYISKKKEGKSNSKFLYKTLIYYKMPDNNVIKYDYKLKKAFLLNHNNKKWNFSEEISNQIINNPSCYERYYYFVDNYENESNLSRYFQAQNGLIIKITDGDFLSYFFDVNKNGWVLDLGILEQIQNGNIIINEVSFDDHYEIIELDLNKGRHL